MQMQVISKCIAYVSSLNVGDTFPVTYSIDNTNRATASVMVVRRGLTNTYDCLFVDCLPFTYPVFEKYDPNIPPVFSYSDVYKLLQKMNIEPNKTFIVLPDASGSRFTLPSVELITREKERAYFEYAHNNNESYSPIMNDRRNRIAFLGDKTNVWCSYWCSNAKDSTNFTGIRGDGGLTYFDCQEPNGLRPMFKIRLL